MQNFNGFDRLWVSPEPGLERVQIKLVTADFSRPVEQQRHVPAILLLQRRVGVDVDGLHGVPACRKAEADFSRHVVA